MHHLHLSPAFALAEESLRVAAVRSCCPQTPPPDRGLDDILLMLVEETALVAATITLVDDQRQWPQGSVGPAAPVSAARDPLCDRVLACDDLVEDHGVGPARSATQVGVPLHIDGRVVGVLVGQADCWLPLDRRTTLWLERAAAMVECRLGSRRRDIALAALKAEAGGDGGPVGRFFRFAHDAMAVIDSSGRFSHVNKAWCALLGARPGEIVQQSLLDYLHPDDLEQVAEQVTAVAGRGQAISVEHRLRTAGAGYRWMQTSLSADPDGQHYFVTVRDITDARRLERLTSDFVSTVSHELRTPLTSIRGALGLVVGGAFGDLQPQVAELLEIASRNATRLVHLVNDILDIERMTAGKLVYDMKETDLVAVVREAVDADQPFAQGFGVRLELEDVQGPVPVYGDAGRLRQVLDNLLSNAVRFSPGGGVVRVRVGVAGDTVRVEVQDEGPGISPEFQDRVFERFAQEESSDTRHVGGSGLGLSITRAIVEAHKGRVAFETAAGIGTTFSVELSTRGAASTPVMAPRRMPTVLICEDDRDVAQALQLLVEALGYAAVVAGTAADARLRLGEQTFDAAIVDAGLPDQNGLEMLQQYQREHGLDLPLIVLSGAVPDASLLDGLSMHFLLRKPISTEELVPAIKRTVSGRAPDSARILHVEDDLELRSVVRALLYEHADLVGVGTLADATAALGRGSYDAIILDLDLPDGDGALVLDRLAQLHDRVPVVLFTGREPDAALVARVETTLVKTRDTEQTLISVVAEIVGRRSAI